MFHVLSSMYAYQLAYECLTLDNSVILSKFKMGLHFKRPRIFSKIDCCFPLYLSAWYGSPWRFALLVEMKGRID